MSQNSGISVESRYVRDNTPLGVPEFCWRCNEKASLRVSRSEENPNRRYFRCDLAHVQRMNGGHTFRWLDDALLQEVKILKQQNAELKQQNAEQGEDISDLFIILSGFEVSENERKKEVKKLKVMLYAVVGAVVFLGLSRFI